MKVAFFLTLKRDVIYLPQHATMRQALERMEHHRYTAVPVLDREGRYVDTLTEGDLLWKMKHTPGMSFAETENVRLIDVPRHFVNHPIHIDAEMEELLGKALDQNFVPVIDGRKVFIGIVRRRDLIQYCLSMVQQWGGISKLADSVPLVDSAAIAAMMPPPVPAPASPEEI